MLSPSLLELEPLELQPELESLPISTESSSQPISILTGVVQREPIFGAEALYLQNKNLTDSFLKPPKGSSRVY